MEEEEEGGRSRQQARYRRETTATNNEGDVKFIIRIVDNSESRQIKVNTNTKDGK